MEIAILTGDKLRGSLDETNISEAITSFLEGRYEAVLKGETAQQLLTKIAVEPDTVETCVVKNVEQFLSGASGDAQASSRELQVLVTGAACLQLFVQNNWLGPLTDSSPATLLPQLFADDQVVQGNALSYLSGDGNSTYRLYRFAGFLHLARCIFVECRHLCTLLQTWDWWLARCLAIQQCLLELKSPTLRATILDALEQISKKESLLHDDKNRDVAVLFHVEASRMSQMYWEDKMARDHVTQAKKLAGLNVELTGALGKRACFQQEHKAQLLVKVTRNEGEQSLPPLSLCNSESSAPVPKSVPLRDDTVLDKINFQDEESSIVEQLQPLEQAVLLVVMESHRRAVAQERITHEEVLTYLEHIISQVTNWTVSVTAHAQRSKLDRSSRRRMERAMQQLEELVNQIRREEPGPAVRLQLFYAARPPTSWDLQRELAAILMSLGCIGDALNIYERLELWEDVIQCYQQINKQAKAESVIREQLAIQETPSLLCFLGDVTSDKTHYEQAWELSNHRSGRAMRCLGYVYFNEKKYKEAVDCFHKSLALNSLQIPVWFTCGCACLNAKLYESAVKAFKRCVNIDYDNFKAWSNMATAYAMLKKKRMAFLTLKNALQCCFDNWRLWDNCLLFATDCGEFEEAIQAYHRLLDLKDKWTDTQVLRIVVKAVVTNMEDAGGNPAARLFPKTLELFGRITSKVTTEGEIWELYGALCRCETPDHKPDLQKAADCLAKSYRCATTNPNWEKDPKQCEKVAQQAIELTRSQQSAVEQSENVQEARQKLNHAKLTIRGVIARIKKQHTDFMTQSVPEPLNTTCNNLDQELQTILTKLEQLNST